MKADQGVIVLIDHAADHGRLRSVLQDWGYSEREIKELLKEMGSTLNEIREQRNDAVF